MSGEISDLSYFEVIMSVRVFVDVCVCVLLTGGMVEQPPMLPTVPSLSVLVLLCSTTCRRLLESLQEKRTGKSKLLL